MTSYVSKKFAYSKAKQFKDTFQDIDYPAIRYVFISKHRPFENEPTPDDLIDTIDTEKDIWDNMFAGKRVTGNDVQMVIPKCVWQSNTKYRQYDDTKTISELTTANTEQQIFPMYVINSQGNVYKCLCNNVGQTSTVEPIGKNLTANGNIQTADQHLWKYLYNIKETNKFLSENWMPVPTSTNELDYDMTTDVVVDGELAKIITITRGSGYYDSNNIIVGTFESACTVLTVSATVNFASNIAVDMSVSGTGITPGTFITEANAITREIRLSRPTSGNGGGSTNPLSITTRIEIRGDGIEAQAVPRFDGDTIDKVIVTNYGKGYSFADIFIYGTGTGATARAVLPPKYGHGYNPAKELGSSSVIISMKIGEVDSTEGGVISANTSIRQWGLLENAHKYGSNNPVSISNAVSVISQTFDLTMIAGLDYNENEFVYQGASNTNPTFSGYVSTQDATTVRLTGTRGTVTPGLVLKGTETNLTGRTVIEVQNPEFQPYTGDILYVQNIESVDREIGQAETLKLIIKF